jgi:hypothetical protein
MKKVAKKAQQKPMRNESGNKVTTRPVANNVRLMPRRSEIEGQPTVEPQTSKPQASTHDHDDDWPGGVEPKLALLEALLLEQGYQRCCEACSEEFFEDMKTAMQEVETYMHDAHAEGKRPDYTMALAFELQAVSETSCTKNSKKQQSCTT